MHSLMARILPPKAPVEPIPPGLYQRIFEPQKAAPFRLHLRIEPDGSGVLIVNAATVVHLNATAAEHVYYLIQGMSAEEAAREISTRYRVTRARALREHREIEARLTALATLPEIDPVTYLGMDRSEPYAAPSAPYRLDCGLTYRMDEKGTLDPLTRERVGEELNASGWRSILDKAWQAGIPHVTFTGGEATLREDLVELISHAEALGQVSGLLTNGLRLSDPTFMERLEQTGLDHLLITLQPSRADSWRGVEHALASDVFTAVHLTLTPENANQWRHSIERLHKMGLGALSLSIREKTEPLAEALQKARQFAAEQEIDLIWDMPVPYSPLNPISLEQNELPQGAGRAWLYVEPDGDVLPAQGVNRVLGNMLHDDWSAVWEQAKRWIEEA